MSSLAVRPDIFVGWFEVEVSQGLVVTRRAYLKRFSTAPYSHCGICMLILCAVTLEPQMHRCVAHTKVMAILLLTYSHVLELGCCHFVVRCMDIIFRVS